MTKGEFASIPNLINSYKCFYHVTPKKNAEGIKKCGLLIHRYPDSDYHKEAPFKKAQTCFCPPLKLEEIKSSIGNGNVESVAVYKISSRILATKDIGLDWTFDGTIWHKHLDPVNWLKKSIDEFGTVCCFENIPFEELERVL